MTRKHFTRLAEELAAVESKDEIWQRCVEAVARACRSFNSNFDWERFVNAYQKGGER